MTRKKNIVLNAGAGGSSAGLVLAGQSVDVALDIDAEMLAIHERNHPQTKHVCADMRKVSVRDVVGDDPVGILTASPPCTQFSRAKSGAVKDADIRDLSWDVLRWVGESCADLVVVENVPEMKKWGPLLADGTVDKARIGETYQKWLTALRALGYEVAEFIVRACDLGVPTMRKRLFIIATRWATGRQPRVPQLTHGPGRALPHVGASTCIDWEIAAKSIFDRKKKLSEKTEARIARGIRKFVLEHPAPFVISLTHHGERSSYPGHEPLPTVTCAHRGELAIVAPAMVQTGYGERPGQLPRTNELSDPLGTLVAGGQKHALVCAMLEKHCAIISKNFGGPATHASDCRDPVATVTCQDHNALVTAKVEAAFTVDQHGTSTGHHLAGPVGAPTAGGRHHSQAVVTAERTNAFLTKYYGRDQHGQEIQTPLGSVTTRDRFGLVVINGVEHRIIDIGMRLLAPKELSLAQGFPKDYDWEHFPDGKPVSKTAQVKGIGNSVCPPAMAAIIKANQ